MILLIPTSLQVLAADVVRDLAASADVGIFVARANASLDIRRHNEDTALGFWLRHMPSRRALTFVNAGGSRVPNLGCVKNSGGYRHPNNRSIVTHFVKTPGGMRYVWQVMRGTAHDPALCKAMSGLD